LLAFTFFVVANAVISRAGGDVTVREAQRSRRPGSFRSGKSPWRANGRYQNDNTGVA
jgi:hypothetical protein